MSTDDIYQKAEQLAEHIFNKVNANLHDTTSNNENILTIVRDSLNSWKSLSCQNGFELVGVDIYLPTQLANLQRNNLKAEFECRGFKYENIGETLSDEQRITAGLDRDNHISNSDPNEPGSSNSLVQQHPEIDARGMPLARFYIDEEELRAASDVDNDNKAKNNADNNNDYQLSLRFSPQMDSPKLKDKAIYKPGPKPPAPMPRMDLTLRPM